MNHTPARRPSLRRRLLIVTFTDAVNGSAISSHTRSSRPSAETTRPPAASTTPPASPAPTLNAAGLAPNSGARNSKAHNHTAKSAAYK